MNLGIHNYFEIAAFTTSVIVWRQIASTPLRWFVFYLFFIVVVELSGRYIKQVLGGSNGWLYNISVPVEYVFFAFLFYKHFRSTRNIQYVKYYILIFPLFVLINDLFVQDILSFSTNILKVGSFFMIIFCCHYFFEILKVELVINPVQHPFFWIVSGLFIFNVGEFVYIALSDSLFHNWPTFRGLVKKINNSLVCTLYSCIITGLLLTKWKQGKEI